MQKNQTQLNSHNQPLNAPVSTPQIPTKYTPFNFGRSQKIQAKQIKLSKMNVKSFVQLSTLASAQGTFGNGQTLFLSTTLTPNPPHIYDINYAIPYIGIYQGTAAITANQIYPALGGSITPGAYTPVGDMDFQAFATATPGSVESAWSGYVINNSAGNQTLLFVTQWKFINFNSGTVSQTG